VRCLVMTTRLQELLFRELERQCGFALMAAQDLEQAKSTEDVDRIWYSIQMLLVSAGNISKMLWPSKQDVRKGHRDSTEAKEVRSLLDCGETSALKARDLRNHFEHFDTRLEEWIRQNRDANFVDSCLEPIRITPD